MITFIRYLNSKWEQREKKISSANNSIR